MWQQSSSPKHRLVKHCKAFLKIAGRSPLGTVLLPASSASRLIIATPGERTDIYRKDEPPLALPLSVCILAADETRVYLLPPPTHCSFSSAAHSFQSRNPFIATLVYSFSIGVPGVVGDKNKERCVEGKVFI